MLKLYHYNGHPFCEGTQEYNVGQKYCSESILISFGPCHHSTVHKKNFKINVQCICQNTRDNITKVLVIVLGKHVRY